ncbi:AAA family ATPase [Brevibacillus ginsengisoli]|uniref:ATP-dependent Clp protease ATP-binding subunit n=1 Tax=Brevibacillus ginsengisoli TaxID=363854 RepID=UPI003CF1C039
MICQHCKENQANVKLNMVINNKAQSLNLCHECYQKVAKGMNVPQPFGSLSGKSPFDQMFSSLFSSSMTPPRKKSGEAVVENYPSQGILDEVCRNLNQAAKLGLIDPVIGRDVEVDRVIEILNRRNKNNPVLIGEPGVGKTAIAEGLALRILEGKVPAKLANKEVYTLDVSSLVAGTGIRGQFEEKMQEIIAELKKRKNILLFIDEIHLLVGAGSAQGSMDAGNILKPALARGELQVIGATTLKEYRTIEKDAALERRFQPVIVKEPSSEEAFEILKGLRPKYEAYHQVAYTDEVLKACVQLSQRYIADRYLPDKAIDLMDEAGSKVNLRHSASDESDLLAKLEQVRQAKEKATQEENYERAASIRKEELELESRLNQVENSAVTGEVRVEDIQEIIEKKTGIPVQKLQQAEQTKMKNLEEQLAAQVIGQEEAVKKVAKAIRRSRAGFTSKTRPIASFLFVGPTGVGKTELTKRLAEQLFGSKEAMIRLDMSEYMEKHSVSKLIGSPPGYVGHEEAGQLTEKVRRNPYSIILLDEVEKAHPDVMHMFLQILEDGRLTDSQGRTVSFKDTVIIATSNAGATQQNRKSLGFKGEEEAEVEMIPLIDNLGDYFRPEFLNRFDAIIPFIQLNNDDLIQIVELMLEDVVTTMKEQGKTITVTKEAMNKLVELGVNPAFGARPLRRAIQEYVEDGIADLIIEEENVTEIRVDVVDDHITVVKIA